MKLAALCCTYRRPHLLGQLIESFLRQDYPRELRELVILDDAGQYGNQSGDRWRLVSIPTRFRTLGEKRNACAALASPDVEGFLVADDDDIYLPHWFRTQVEALRRAEWSRPGLVLVEHDSGLKEMDTAGLYHGGWAFRRSAFDRVRGYGAMNNGEDQELARRLTEAKVTVSDPSAFAPPFYHYRNDNGSYHLCWMGERGYEELGCRSHEEKAELQIGWPRDFTTLPIVRLGEFAAPASPVLDRQLPHQDGNGEVAGEHHPQPPEHERPDAAEDRSEQNLCRLVSIPAVCGADRTPETCRFRKTARPDTPAAEAHCTLLDEAFGVSLGQDARVALEVCESCCSEPEPSPEQLNPTIASLVYGISEGLADRSGRLNRLALHVLKTADDSLAGSREVVTVPGSPIRFVRRSEESVGRGVHRSGWPFARSWLEKVDPGQSILLDDFVEQTFCFPTPGRPHTEPWIGIFHYPPSAPPFAGERDQLQLLFRRPQWRESARWLRGAIALSDHLAHYLRSELSVPVEVVRHPIGRAALMWSPEALRSGPSKQLVQLGGFLRNTRAIFQVRRIEGFRKMRVLPRLEWLVNYDTAVAEHWNHTGGRVEYGGVQDLGFVSPPRYDRLLAGSVILTELFDASANNVVLECIASATPLVINRHPACMEYLGEKYPLFFDDIEEVAGLLSDDRLEAAHEYLRSMDQDRLSGEVFARSCDAAFRRILSQRDETLPRPTAGSAGPPGTQQFGTTSTACSLLNRPVTAPIVVSTEAAPDDCIHRTDRLVGVEWGAFDANDPVRVYECRLHGPCAPVSASLPAGIDARGCLTCRDYSQTRTTRVALLTPFWKLGGSERWFLALLRNLRGIECTGIALPEGAPTDQAMVEEALRYCRVVGTRVLSRESNSNRVERVADHHDAVAAVTNQADVVLAWGLSNLRELRKLFDAKTVVLLSHGTDAWTERFLAASAPSADRLVAVSEAARRTFPAGLRERVSVIWNGVEIDRITPTRRSPEVRAAWGVGPRDLLIGFAGRFDPNKRPEITARAAAAAGGVAVFRSAGQRDPVIEAHIRSMLGNRCLFADGEPLGDFYHAVDCVLLPSRNEGLSLVGLEAWITGRPLVATPVGGLPELEREFGPLTVAISPEPTERELAEAVRRAVSDDFRPTVEKARQLAWERFTAARMAREWEEFLLQAVSEKSRSST